MNTRPRELALAAAIAVLATPAPAEVYRVTVTLNADGLYQVDGTSLYVQTRYCYEYAYSEDAILKYDSSCGYTKGVLYFLDSEESYDIEEIYSAVMPEYGSKVLTESGELEDIDVILIPTSLG